MKKRLNFIIALTLVLSLFAGALSFPALSFENDVPISSDKVLLINTDTNTVVYNKNADSGWYSSYMTALMTFVIAAESSTDIFSTNVPITSELLDSIPSSDGTLNRFVDNTLTIPQFLKKKQFDYYNSVIGMRQILWGLVKKLVIADNLAGYVDNLLYHPSVISATSIIMAAILFAFQIYTDFSGYSDIAIGSARLFNIKLIANFRYPFFSRSMKELWQRWHISLMTWLREYIYFPLGGSRRGKWRTCVNIMIVFAISGLWHGADWTFVTWGTVNGLMLLPFVFLKKTSYSDHARLRDVPKCLLTFLIFALIFLSFRSPNISHLEECISTLIHGSYLTMPMGISAFYYIVPFMITEWLGRKHEFPIMTLRMPTVARWAIYWALLFIIAFYGAKADIQYIYFQF